MDNFEREVLERLKTIEIKIESYGDAKTKTYENEKRILLIENELKDMREEIEKQQAESTWLKRTVIAAIITGVIGIGITLLRSEIGL